MSRKRKVFKQRYYRNLNNLSLCRPVLLSGNPNLNTSQEGEIFKQRCYRDLNNLSFCRPVLLIGNVQSEHVSEAESIQTTILSGPKHFKPLQAVVSFR